MLQIKHTPVPVFLNLPDSFTCSYICLDIHVTDDNHESHCVNICKSAYSHPGDTVTRSISSDLVKDIVSLISDFKPLQCENDEGTERFSFSLRCDFILFLRLSFIQIVFLLLPCSCSLYAGMFGAFTVLTRLTR